MELQELKLSKIKNFMGLEHEVFKRFYDKITFSGLDDGRSFFCKGRVFHGLSLCQRLNRLLSISSASNIFPITKLHS